MASNLKYNLQRLHGAGLVLAGDGIRDLVSEALSAVPANAEPRKHFYMTVLTESELLSLSVDRVDALKAETSRVYCIGAGKSHTKELYFAVIVWAEGQQLRKSLGLAPINFHICLTANGKQDVETDTDYSIHGLLPGQFPAHPSPELLDHLVFTLHLLSDYSTAQLYCVDLILAQPDSFRGYLRLADAAFQGSQYKLAMLSYARAFDLSSEDKVRRFCLKWIEKCSHYSEWGPVFQESEKKEVPERLASLLSLPWSENLKGALDSLVLSPTLCLESRNQLYLPIPSTTPAVAFQRLPRFFRWIVPFHLCVMSTPKTEADISALSSMGIRTVLTLTEEEPLPQAWFTDKPISNSFLPIPNYHPPSIEQMDVIMQLLQDDTKVPILVHCGGGKGRAGTVIACYLAAYGFSKSRLDQDHPELSANEAISALRSLRPGSLETSQQEAFVSKWCSTIWKRQSVFPDRPSEPPPCQLVIDGELEADANLFMLIGLPGSGKSWLSRCLIARDRKGWAYISQDESGSRASCEREIGYERNGRVLLDRCNTSDVDRQWWLSLASNWARNPVCIWFDYPQELCLSRAQMRIGHPTLPPGGRVRAAVDQMNKSFVRPSLKEGFKAIIIIRSFEAARELVLRLSPRIGIYKFPRTAHLLDLGAATSDDLILPPSSISPFSGRVVITEKVDGANMGFSLSSDRSQIIVQNRSHYVNSSSHEQFKKLGHWVDVHRDELFQLLNRDEHFPERYVLFGEWLYATHSIPYSRLPERFMAFDLYDRSLDVFVNRRTLQGLLERTTIAIVPLVYEGEMPSEDKLKEMVQSPSMFYDGRVEGVYVKWENGGWVGRRGKVVRADFIAGNEHWSKKDIQVNGLALVSDL